MLNFLTKGISQIFGTKSDKDNKELQPYVKLTNDEFVKLANLSHDEFRAKTKELQDYIAQKLSHIDDQIDALKEGIDKELAKKIVAHVKDAKLKVQAAIQGEQVRITGKKRDDLQDAIAALRAKTFDMPLQFNNFRD